MRHYLNPPETSPKLNTELFQRCRWSCRARVCVWCTMKVITMSGAGAAGNTVLCITVQGAVYIKQFP